MALHVECERVSQERLALELGVSVRSIGSWERGEHPLPPVVGWALAGVYRPLRNRLRREADQARRAAERRKRREADQRRHDELKARRRLARAQRRALHQQVALIGPIMRRGRNPTAAEVLEIQRLRDLINRKDP